MIKKRGISPVIATVLLIVLTISAIVLIAQFLIPFIRDNLKKSSECVPYQDHFNFEEKFDTPQGEVRYNCYDSKGLYGASVRASTLNNASDNTVVGFDLIFIREDSSIIASARSGANTDSEEGGIRMLRIATTNIRIPSQGEVQTYVVNGSSEEIYTRAEIYPVLKNNRVCERSDSITLTPCGVSLEI